jgi:alcohol dehydrogenase class IV
MGLADTAANDNAAVARLIDGLHRINADLNVPTPKSYGIDAKRWDELIPFMTEQALASGSPCNNPRVPEAAEIQDIYRKIWA